MTLAQFDVHALPDRRGTGRLVVTLQSARFDRAKTRLVAALVPSPTDAPGAAYLAPEFDVAGRSFILDVFNIASLPASVLGRPVASLADEVSRAKLVRALDELLSQA